MSAATNSSRTLEKAMKRIGAIALCLAAVSPAMAMEIRYSANSGKFEAIRIDSDQPETDSLLYAVCVTPAMFEVLIGDELKFGSGGHEPVSATLSDGTLSTKVDGVSVRSPDYEMTGGTVMPVSWARSIRAPTGMPTNSPARSPMRAHPSYAVKTGR